MRTPDVVFTQQTRAFDSVVSAATSDPQAAMHASFIGLRLLDFSGGPATVMDAVSFARRQHFFLSLQSGERTFALSQHLLLGVSANGVQEHVLD